MPDLALIVLQDLLWIADPGGRPFHLDERDPVLRKEDEMEMIAPPFRDRHDLPALHRNPVRFPECDKRLPQRKQSGMKTGWTGEGLVRGMRRGKRWRCGGRGEWFTI